MAVGDVLAQMISIPASSSATFQPASGTEYAIVAVVLPSSGITASIYNGTSSVSLGTTSLFSKLFINNSVYLQFAAGSSAVVVAVSGVQTK